MLDARYSADSSEIEAFLSGFGISMLRVFPQRNWNPTRVAMYHPINDLAIAIADMEDAHVLVCAGQVELAVLHTDEPNFQHYDCLKFSGDNMRFSPNVNARVLGRFKHSTLAAAVMSGNSLGAVRCALHMLGKAIPV